MALASIEEAIAAIGRGEMIILVDDEDRENEGDLVVAAEKVTPEAVNFMAKYGRGLICLSLTEQRLREMQIPMMVPDTGAEHFGTAFTVSIEARHGVTTGISAADRARTIQVAIDEGSRPQDLVTPGHIFPLRAKKGGVLVRTGHTEGSIDLAKLAGLKPAAVICEILNDDGSMARVPDLERFAEEHGLLIASIADLVEYRFRREHQVEMLVETPFPNAYHPDFRLRVYKSIVDGAEHLVLILGDPTATDEPFPVRVQHQAIVGDVFRGTAIDCGWQLHGALEYMAREGRGVLVYLHKPEMSRFDTVRRYVLGEVGEQEVHDAELLEEKVINTVKPELRELGVGCQILSDCGVRKMRLLTSSSRRYVGLDGYGLEVVEYLPVPKPAYYPDSSS